MKQVKRVQLHPITIREIKKGHPWVTSDKFSDKFPKNDFFLIGKGEKNEDLCLLVNDPNHTKVKARLWSTDPKLFNDDLDFASTLRQRLVVSFNQRVKSKISEDRENYYLVFGEADSLPGLMIQKLGSNILIQYYARFWRSVEEILMEELLQALSISEIRQDMYFWIQERGNPKAAPFNLAGKIEEGQWQSTVSLDEIPEVMLINEFGINYQISFKRNYDLGIYTDMSSIRKKLIGVFPEGMKMLNLYAYTGAFSTFALKQNAESVTSVDLSGNYISWLESNIKLNPELDPQKHQSMVMPAKKALQELSRKKETFDFIVCDPPSASSDKKKTTSALQEYKELLPLMLNVTQKGGYLLLFLNTHQINLAKFRGQISSILRSIKKDSTVKEQRTFGLGDDCPRLKGFKEGDYLKGILLRVK